MNNPERPGPAALSVAGAKAGNPALSRLMESLDPDAPLTLDLLREHAAPGNPLDELALLTIILDYLRAAP